MVLDPAKESNYDRIEEEKDTVEDELTQSVAATQIKSTKTKSKKSHPSSIHKSVLSQKKKTSLLTGDIMIRLEKLEKYMQERFNWLNIKKTPAPRQSKNIPMKIKQREIEAQLILEKQLPNLMTKKEQRYKYKVDMTERP